MPIANAPAPVRTRLANLTPAFALGVVAALLMLIGLGLALPPTTSPGGGPGGGDAALYRQIAARVAHGEPYHHAAAVEQRASGYPLRPFTAMRQPALAEMTAWLGPVAAQLLLRLLAAAAAAGTAMRLVPQLRTPIREGAVLLSAISAAGVLQDGMWVWHEVWAGLLITLALACRTERRWAVSVALGLSAALIRELAFPFLLVMAAAAWADGSRREAKAWVGAAMFALAMLAVHMKFVWSVNAPGDVVSPGWLYLGGWRFDLALARQSSLLMGVPSRVSTLVTPLALLGWAAWRGAYASRVTLIIALWMACFMILGRPDNNYWGFLFAPLLTVGLALAPAALRDLGTSLTSGLPGFNAARRQNAAYSGRA